MNDNTATAAYKPQHLEITRFLFYIVFIGTALQGLWLIVHAFYFGTLPDASINLVNTGNSYFAQGLFGTLDISFKELCFNSNVTNSRLFLISFCIVEFLVRTLPLLFIMLIGRRLLTSLSHSHSPFTAETTACIKKMGLTMLLMGLLSKLIFQASLNIINLHELNFENPWEFHWILSGVITILLADIFERGCSLQQEVDETL